MMDQAPATWGARPGSKGPSEDPGIEERPLLSTDDGRGEYVTAKETGSPSLGSLQDVLRALVWIWARERWGNRLG